MVRDTAGASFRRQAGDYYQPIHVSTYVTYFCERADAGVALTNPQDPVVSYNFAGEEGKRERARLVRVAVEHGRGVSRLAPRAEARRGGGLQDRERRFPHHALFDRHERIVL